MNLRRLTSVCGVASALFWLAPASAPAQQQNASLTVPLFGDTTVEVDVDNGGARFLPAAASENGAIVVKSNASGPTPSQLPVQTTRSGKRVIITLGRGGGASQLPFVAKPQVAYDVIYPSRLKLIVHAFGGDINVMNPATAVSVSAASGDVLVENPHAPISVDDQSGAVTVHGAVAALDLASDAGNVSADLDPSWLPRPIRMQAAAGNLHLTVPPNFSAHVDASSQNGTVHNVLSSAANGASGPPVWLFAEHGDVTIDFPKPKT
jgi:Putative adhesin